MAALRASGRFPVASPGRCRAEPGRQGLRGVLPGRGVAADRFCLYEGAGTVRKVNDKRL